MLIVRDIRKKLGLNQTEFGMLFGASNVTISRWETDKLTPSMHRKMLLDAFSAAVLHSTINDVDVKFCFHHKGPIYTLYYILDKAHRG